MQKVAKYQKLKEEIQNKIRSKEWKPNQIIPSEHHLCSQYQVSRITVRKAVDELVHEDVLYRIHGKGYFVKEKVTDKLSQIYSFTEAIVNQGKTPSKKQLSLCKKQAGAELADEMGIAPEEMVYEIKSLYLADGVPYCINTCLLPEYLFPKLEYFNFNNHSLYQVLRDFYHLEMTRAQQTLMATLGTQEINQLLENQDNKPLLYIDARSFCLHKNDEKIFEMYKAYVLTDILSYSVENYNI